MPRGKKIRTKGKIKLSQYFQNLIKGDIVSVNKERSFAFNFPLRIQGRTGTVERKIGSHYFVKIKDRNKEKKFLIEPLHLKKLGGNNIKSDKKN